MNKLTSSLVAGAFALSAGPSCGTTEAGVRVDEDPVDVQGSNVPKTWCVVGSDIQCCDSSGRVDSRRVADEDAMVISASSSKQIESVLSCSWNEKWVKDLSAVACSTEKNMSRIIKTCIDGQVIALLQCGATLEDSKYVWTCVKGE